MEDSQNTAEFSDYENIVQGESVSDTPPPVDVPVGVPAQSDGGFSVTEGTDSAPAKPIVHVEQNRDMLPPHNLDIEASLLGAMLRNDTILQQKLDKLTAEHFYAPEHQTLFGWIRNTVEAGQKATPTTLAHLANITPNIKALGGKEYLSKLASDVISLVNAREYQDTLIDLFTRRQLIALGENVVEGAYDLDFDNTAQHQIEVAEQSLYNLAEKGDMDKGTIPFVTALTQTVETTEQAFLSDGGVIGIPTGLKDMDEQLGGLMSSDLLILAARPAMGKTALATNIAFYAAKTYEKYTDDTGKQRQNGGVVLFFSLEMSAEQLAQRILAEQSEIPSNMMRKGRIKQDQMDTLTQKVQDIKNYPLFIDDTPGLSVTAMRQKARRQQRKHGLDLIIVDYVQLLQGPSGKKFDNRVNEVSEITRHLKLIAKDLEVPIIALSQLSRAVEQRIPPRPQLSDLRDSGSIEQDADVVMFIYRGEYYLKEPERREKESEEKYMKRVEWYNKEINKLRNKAEVIIAKNRHGATATIDLFFKRELTRFSDLDPYH